MPRKSSFSKPQPKRSNSGITSPSSPNQDLGRATSMRLCNRRDVNIPIPPSLLQSPHLNSPWSPFQRTDSVPSTPSEEDEQWLGDTVPLSASSSRVVRSESTKENSRSPRSPRSPRSNVVEGGAIMASKSIMMRPEAPPSPPLVRKRQSSQDKVQTPSMRLARAGEQDYFFLSQPGK
ncbi:hypothetical protein BT96DRAFT_253661 [Gymnopus androsaceus JB14]|uniref:Uncharacterized protein n=1 Tax=Gymnopus androsaceus JB14 TaxID=1447944 RepID=A0A6A4I788_9AGAR|nr:hypothetical protein BT96DRAFT_253661 [Gymnopus androsaceus JB14]